MLRDSGESQQITSNLEKNSKVTKEGKIIQREIQKNGKLHAPSDICGPLFEEELNFWGLDEKTMEPCCWTKYTEHRDAQENLKVFDSPLLNPQDDEETEPVLRINNPTILKEDERFKSRIFKYIRPSFFSSLKWVKTKKNLWAIMEGRSEKRPMLAKVVSFISLTFIVLSVLSLFFHSMLLVLASANHKTFSYFLITLDYMTFVWMVLELTLRFLSCPRRLSFILSIVTLIDVLVLITYALQFDYGNVSYHKEVNFNATKKVVVSRDMKNIELFSIVRLLRLWRFFRLTIGLQIFKHTLIASSRELFLLMLLLSIPVAFFATVVYFCEREKESTKFKTIPESIWWALITITTVGYGDMSPLSTWGKLCGSICAMCSVLILALPVSIIGNNFSLFYNYAQARMKLPKRPKIALVGAANALVAETSQHSMSPDIDDSDVGSHDNDEVDGERTNTSKGLPRINLGSDPDFTANVTSKRFRRERLSLFASSPSRQSTRRSKSMGNSASKIRQRQRNGNVDKRKPASSDDEVSDTGSEKFEVFKPIGLSKLSNVTNSFENDAFDDNNDNNNKTSEVATEEKEESKAVKESKLVALMVEQNESNIRVGLPVPIVETVFTESSQNENANHLTNGHLPPLLNEPLNSTKQTSYRKLCSPPVSRKKNGEIECKKPVLGNDLDSPDFSARRKKHSNNHLYVPHDV